MIAIPGVPGNKETSKEIRNRKICTRRGSREQGAEVAGLNTKASSLYLCPLRGTESGTLMYASVPRTKRSPAPYAKQTKTAGQDYHARCFPDLS